MKKYKTRYFSLLICTKLLSSCTGFLEIKPDAKMVIPNSLEDCELLLNDYSTMNMKYPNYGEVASDNYFLSATSWTAISDIDERNVHIWSDEPIVSTTQWQGPYKAIYQANQVLSVLQKLKDQGDMKWKICNASAHFFRAFAMQQIMDVFTLPYQKNTASITLGIPIKLTPNVDDKSVRSTLEETCRQIVSDYKASILELPVHALNNGLPSKASGYAGIARLYMNMQEYNLAYLYADSALQLHSELLDYNTLDATENLPFQRFNKEVIFPATTPSSYALGQSYARIDHDLYAMYEDSDLRKKLFFRTMTDGQAFKGSYDNTLAGLFVGFTTAELYLIRAESAVRTNRFTQANVDINFFKSKRYDHNSIAISDLSQDELLETILKERRKELIFRGVRWSDLKRLNQQSEFGKVLSRAIGGKSYILEPKSLKYAILIPEIVIQESGMFQNLR